MQTRKKDLIQNFKKAVKRYNKLSDNIRYYRLLLKEADKHNLSYSHLISSLTYWRHKRTKQVVLINQISKQVLS